MSQTDAHAAILDALDLLAPLRAIVLFGEPAARWRPELWRSADGLRVQVFCFAVRWGHA